MTTYRLQVNGKQHAVDVDADTPLLYVLRNELALSGAAGQLDVSAQHVFMPTLVRRHSVAQRQNVESVTNSGDSAM